MIAAAPLFGTARGAERAPRAISFAAGLGANAALVTLVLILQFPAAVPRAIAATVVLIAPAPPVTARRIPPPLPGFVPERHFRPPLAPPRIHPILVAPPPTLARAMMNQPPPSAAAPKPVMAVPRPVITGVFSAPRTVHPPSTVARVEVASFPGAVASAAPSERHAAIEEGSFATAGSIAATRSGPRNTHLAADTFGSAASAAPARGAPPAVAATPVFDLPVAAPSGHRFVRTAETIGSAVRILAKPKPQYTEEARRLRIEGEVWIEILFGADGTVKIQRVVRPLGHGLDESAVAAARQIRFHPANDGSRDVDQIATIRVQFLLAD